jgi:hypothetical protein
LVTRQIEVPRSNLSADSRMAYPFGQIAQFVSFRSFVKFFPLTSPPEKFPGGVERQSWRRDAAAAANFYRR